jgi:hypothetical protein
LEKKEEFIWGFGGEYRRERLIGRYRCRWENNIKMYLREME